MVRSWMSKVIARYHPCDEEWHQGWKDGWHIWVTWKRTETMPANDLSKADNLIDVAVGGNREGWLELWLVWWVNDVQCGTIVALSHQVGFERIYVDRRCITKPGGRWDSLSKSFQFFYNKRMKDDGKCMMNEWPDVWWHRPPAAGGGKIKIWWWWCIEGLRQLFVDVSIEQVQPAENASQVGLLCIFISNLNNRLAEAPWWAHSHLL